ncbi:MAG TPA: biopolymer transporter ExbD [Paracoccaceae bacterium]
MAEGRRPIRCPIRRRALSVTSLIDVIFLLLLFFMLSSTFTRTGEIALGIGGGGEAMAKAVPVFLRLSAGDLLINGRPAELAGAAAAVRALGSAAAAAPIPVLVSLTPEVSAQRLADLLAALRAVPGARVQVLG